MTKEDCIRHFDILNHWLDVITTGNFAHCIANIKWHLSSFKIILKRKPMLKEENTNLIITWIDAMLNICNRTHVGNLDSNKNKLRVKIKDSTEYINNFMSDEK